MYNGAVDDTTSYIARFQTLSLSLAPSDPGSPLPFVLTPMLLDTTLLSSSTPLVYGDGVTAGLPAGAPALNATDHTHYFTGRSDNFDATKLSTNPANARLDPEGIRVSNNGRRVYISDEYGPYVYEFNRKTGRRVRSFSIPDNLAVAILSAHGDTEIGVNTSGRVANKGMEGLAITPARSSRSTTTSSWWTSATARAVGASAEEEPQQDHRHDADGHGAEQ